MINVLFQIAMNDTKVILHCLEYYRLDLMFVLSYIYWNIPLDIEVAFKLESEGAYTILWSIVCL